MYFVERAPDSYAVYDSAADLSQAIRQGVVGPGARIFHRLSAQWLPITKHPLYRQANSPAESEPLPPLGRRHWTFLPDHAPHAQPADERLGHGIRRPQGKPGEATGATPTPTAAESPRRWLPESLRVVVARLRSRGRLKTS